MLIEKSYITYNLISNFYHVYHHFQNIQSKMCMTFTLTLQYIKVKCKYANQKSIYDLLFDGNHNFYPISHHFKVIHCQNVHNLDLDL